MGIFDYFRRTASPEAHMRPQAAAQPGQSFSGLNDPALLEYIRRGEMGGDYGRQLNALKNMATLRCMSLLSESVGMMPLNLMDNGPTKAYATDHPVYRLLKLKPNSWQTPYEWKSGMQLNALAHGNAYSRVIWSAGRPIALIPMDPEAVRPSLTSAFQMVYDYTRPDGGVVRLQANEVFHLRDMSLDGICGMSRLRLAREAIALSRQAELAAARVFDTGVMAGGAIEVPTPLSETAYKRMKDSLNEDYSGADNVAKWMLLEENAKANQFGTSASDAQHIENRNMQIEEVARAFGVPRPLLMMDDTSWGSGIEQLGIFFVQYGLQHWFTAWEQAAQRVLLTDAELGVLTVKFNERALLRGTLTDQANFFTKALGAGGQAPWATQNEIRELQDMPESSDPAANLLRNPMTQPRTPNEPAEAA